MGLASILRCIFQLPDRRHSNPDCLNGIAHYKEDLEAATLQWVDNKAKSKKYAAIAQGLAEFEDALK